MEKTRAKKNNNGGIDRLSNLPDAMLLHILSFLPTITCVNTMSLVSHRYRNLWQHLQALNVNEREFDNFLFLSIFVDNFLFRRKSRNIRKLRLSFNEFPAPYIDAWIHFAVGPFLEEIHLDIFSDEDDHFTFPLNILSSCPNLVSLSLHCDILRQMQPICSSSAVCFPLLKKMKLRPLGEVDVSEVDVLLSDCPILETLEVSLSPISENTLHVPHSLKSLTINVDNEVGVCLEIDAPGLKYLSLINVAFRSNAIGNLHKVEEAYLDFYYTHSMSLSVDPLHNLFRALSGIKHLVLDSPTELEFDGEFPEFQHLLHLELILPCFSIGFLYHMLQKCPMLQTLKIENQDSPSLSYGWAPTPKSVPNCLVSHLTFIHFIGFQGYFDEIKFIRYVLRKGLVLKTMHISRLFKEKGENNILTQLSNTPRGSVSCKLKID